MPRTVIIIRHAMPVVSADRPAADWPLSAAGRRAAAELAPELPDDAVWAASTERKAVETVSVAAGVDHDRLRRDRRFDEVRRPGEPFDDDVRDRRRAWIEGRTDERHRGWESVSRAARRFDAAVAELTVDGSTIVIGSHGMVITAWLISRGVVPAGERAGAFWAGLRFPDLLEISIDDGGRVRRRR